MFETNSLIINDIRQINKKAIIIVVSYDIKETKLLYKEGATYVIMPHFLGGTQASVMIDKYKLNADKFLKEKEKHLKELKTKKKLGYEHPKSKHKY